MSLRRSCAYVLLYLLCVLPYAATLFSFHPDERHYSESVVRMMQSDNVWVPREADGSPRFLKPILSYWAIMLSYACLGIGPLALRLPSLLAGCGVLVLTHRLALRVTGDAACAGLAPWILLSHWPFLLAGYRGNPDMLLTLFLLVSIDGFHAALQPKGGRRAFLWEAYLGWGLAVATKGLLALLLLPVVYGFAMVGAHARRGAIRLLHGPAMVLGALVASGWYVAVFVLHGPEALQAFWGDQVGEKMTWIAGLPLVHAIGLVLVYGLSFAPWTVLALLPSRRAWFFGYADPELRRFHVPAWTWIAIGIIVFSFGTSLRVRYLLPFSPLVAVCLVPALAGAHVSALGCSRLRPLLQGMLVVMLLCGAVVTVAHVQMGARVFAVAMAGVTMVIAGALRWIGGMSASRLTPGHVAAIVPLVLPLAWVAVGPFVFPVAEAGIMAHLRSLSPRPPCVVCVGSDKVVSRLNLHAGDAAPVSYAPITDLPRLPADVLIVYRDDRACPLAWPGCRWQAVAGRIGHVEPWACLKALAVWRLRPFLEAHRARYLVGVPCSGGADPGGAERGEAVNALHPPRHVPAHGPSRAR